MRCMQDVDKLTIALEIFLPVGMCSLVYNATMMGLCRLRLELQEQDGIRDVERGRSQLTTAPCRDDYGLGGLLDIRPYEEPSGSVP